MNRQTKQTLAKLTDTELLMAQKASPVVVQKAVNEFAAAKFGPNWKQVAQAKLDETK